MMSHQDNETYQSCMLVASMHDLRWILAHIRPTHCSPMQARTMDSRYQTRPPINTVQSTNNDCHRAVSGLYP